MFDAGNSCFAQFVRRANQGDFIGALQHALFPVASDPAILPQPPQEAIDMRAAASALNWTQRRMVEIRHLDSIPRSAMNEIIETVCNEQFDPMDLSTRNFAQLEQELEKAFGEGDILEYDIHKLIYGNLTWHWCNSFYLMSLTTHQFGNCINWHRHNCAADRRDRQPLHRAR